MKSTAHSSAKAVTGKEMGSTSSSYLNASYLISNFTSKSNDTHSFASDGVQLGNGTSPFSDFARSDLLGLNKKLLATLQRMERIQGRINSLESKFKNMNECVNLFLYYYYLTIINFRLELPLFHLLLIGFI